MRTFYLIGEKNVNIQYKKLNSIFVGRDDEEMIVGYSINIKVKEDLVLRLRFFVRWEYYLK